MVIKILAWAAIALSLTCVGVPGARADDEYDLCLNEAGVSLLTIGYCGQDFVKREEKKLGHVWGRLMREANDDVRKILTDEQILWLRYRDAACEFYSAKVLPQESEMAGLHQCRAKIVAERTATLEQVFSEMMSAR